MAEQYYFVLTAAQRTEAMALNGVGVGTNPIGVSGAAPGTGLNRNAVAEGYALGAPIDLVGCFVAPYAMADDPQCEIYAPGLVPYLLTLPSALLEDETIFVPAEL